MNFFDRQDKARRVTRWLVIVFFVATALIVASVALLAGAVSVMLNAGQPEIATGANAQVMLPAAVFTALFILGATAWKTAHLARGGGRVAMDMGGTLVAPDSSDPLRRRLRNVVEEMAIASGVPVPEIYVLEAEPGINAFAAGFAPGDAAVAVTRGTLEALDRDELQGVIAHEFSHILNGDMRLNIRLMGVLFGIMVLGLIGRTVLRSGTRSRGWSSRRSRAQPVVLLVGLGLTIVGWIGVLLARIIKAAVSRQREFLADASAVQFTRQTDGIAGALKKIGGYTEHSYIRAVDAEEISHMLFSGGQATLTSLFATHPPLIERIRALDPSFRESDYPTQRQPQRADADAAPQDSQLAAGVTAALAASAGASPSIGGEISDSIGDPQARHVEFAQALRRSVPADLYDAAHSRELSLLLAVALAMHPEAAVAARQARTVHEMLGQDRASLVTRFHRELGNIGPAYRLPLLEICFPMLKLRPQAQLEFLLQLVQRLAETDGQVDLHEYCYYRILASQLGQSVAPGKQRQRRRASKQSIRQAAAGLIRILAQQGNASVEGIEQAYQAGLAELGDWARDFASELPTGDTVAALDASLDALSGLTAKSQQRLVAAVSRCIAHDGKLELREAELLRAVCATLNCPLPPVLATVTH